LAEADQLLSLALRFSHPNPTTQLLNAYGNQFRIIRANFLNLLFLTMFLFEIL
jgi:hypothetical protein